MNTDNLIKQGNRYYDPEEGKYYRYRRGELVEIPAHWVGCVTTPATIRRRDSKLIRKLRMKAKRNKFRGKEFVDDINKMRIDYFGEEE